MNERTKHEQTESKFMSQSGEVYLILCSVMHARFQQHSVILPFLPFVPDDGCTIKKLMWTSGLTPRLYRWKIKLPNRPKVVCDMKYW